MVPPPARPGGLGGFDSVAIQRDSTRFTRVVTYRPNTASDVSESKAPVASGANSRVRENIFTGGARDGTDVGTGESGPAAR
jgi:hypothetical protein